MEQKDVLEYIRDGFIWLEAMVNFITTLGWNDGTEQIYSIAELIGKI